MPMKLKMTPKKSEISLTRRLRHRSVNHYKALITDGALKKNAITDTCTEYKIHRATLFRRIKKLREETAIKKADSVESAFGF